MITKEKVAMQLVCFSHLPWKFVYQRPQHLLTRFTKNYAVYYVEEYRYSDDEDGYTISIALDNVTIVLPHLQRNSSGKNTDTQRMEKVIQKLFSDFDIDSYIFWYYTPMALAYTNCFQPQTTVYDCMDELSAFKFAPDALRSLEQQLFKKEDIVFTGGNTLYESKKSHHHNIFPFPSSIDKPHFKAARIMAIDMPDQQHIPHPRFGFYGVIDERFDIELIKKAADARPEWQFILIGPVIKIDPESLPRNSNIHYLGAKSYEELPMYLGGWDIALIPFAINESTRFISPTKTPEYLAGGKPVISTPITDVIYPYGNDGLVHIASTAEELVEQGDAELSEKDKTNWLERVDEYLSHISWDTTWKNMNNLVQTEIDKKEYLLTEKVTEYVRLFDSGGRAGRISTGRAAGLESQ